jgi:class 3 adenylate cyclase
MLCVAILYVYVIQFYNMMIDNHVSHENDVSLTHKNDITTLLFYETVLYMSYMIVFSIMNTKMYVNNRIGPAFSLAVIKIYNGLLCLTAKHKTITHVNNQFIFTWLFTAPLVLTLFSQTVNTDMNLFICREMVMHMINIIYNMFEWNTCIAYMMYAMMYALYITNLVGMYHLENPNKYLLLYGWIMVGICEIVYTFEIIDTNQHIIVCIVNDMIVKGIIYGVLAFQEMVNQYSNSKIQVNHLQIMNDICKLIGTEDNNLTLNQIKTYLKSVIHNENVIRESKNEMSEMVFCKHFSLEFTRSVLSSKSVHVEDVCILFSDIVKYSELCNTQDSHDVLIILDNVYKCYDKTLQHYPSLQKIENIGDCYFVTSKLDGTLCSVDVYKSMNDIIQFSCSITRLSNEQYIDIRVGLHVGNVSVGIIGKDIPRFAVVGQDVNITARLESTCSINKIHVSEQVRDLLFKHNTIGVKLSNEQIVNLKNIGDFITYTIYPYDCNLIV